MQQNIEKPSADEVKEWLHYDQSSGEFRWNKRGKGGRRVVGEIAGTVNLQGYIQIGLFGTRYLAHRLAWLCMTSEWPPKGMTIDHENGDRVDNRWSNLRLATKQQNVRNSRKPKHNTSGFKGVSWVAETKVWRASIKVSGKTKSKSGFKTAEEAHRAYCKFLAELDCDFVRAG